MNLLDPVTGRFCELLIEGDREEFPGLREVNHFVNFVVVGTEVELVEGRGHMES